MPVTIPNPYSGKDEESCSVSFAAQQQMKETDLSGQQTEAQYNTSKQLGEWGVIKAKLAAGGIPSGTKVLSYEANSGTQGYFVVKGSSLEQVYFFKGKRHASVVSPVVAEAFIKNPSLKTAIPQAVSDKPKPEKIPFTVSDAGVVGNDTASLSDGQIIAVNEAGDYLAYNAEADTFDSYVKGDYGHTPGGSFFSLKIAVAGGGPWYKPDGKQATPKAEPAVATPAAPKAAPIAAPVATPPVATGSTSVGSMTHEDVAALFVKIKDDLAKEKGLNIKGANPELDALVHKAIGEATGYTPAEVASKINAYKAEGNKLSALKKKVLSGTYKVPQPTKPVPQDEPAKDFKPLSKPDPKPNGVPTQATPKLQQTIKQEVKKEAEAKPQAVYSNEDVAAAYIIAKDSIVAASNGKWTLYTKSEEMDLEIAIKVGLKTGLNPQQQKQAIAEYLASGKKLSQLKKSLAKQGAFTPKADTLKSKSTVDPDKAKDVEAKADAGYTPTPAPSAGNPPTETGKPAPKRVEKEAQEAGDISGFNEATKKLIFDKFKAKGYQSYLSSGSPANYEAFASLQAELKAFGWGKDLTLLQLIRVVDEQGAKKAGVDNGHLFEKKVATWLTTSEGTAYIKANEQKLAQQAKQAKLAAEMAKIAKEMEANQPPLPADSAQYQPWDLAKAKRVSQTWLDANPWTTKQQRDLKHYTGNAYTEMNGYLRKGETGSITDRSKTAIAGARAGMRPTTEPILVQRGTGLGQFSSLGISGANGDTLFGATGKTFKDEGFLSTSAGGRAAFVGQARLEIECPVGTPMAYVAPISKYPHENEMLLQAGMEYTILNVRKEGPTYVVRMRVTNWPGKGA